MSDNAIKLLDIVVKGFLGILVTALATIYGLHLQSDNQLRTQHEAAAQSIIDLSSKQKDLDVQTTTAMFQSLVASYLQTPVKQDHDSLRQRLTLLRLVALNYQDTPIQLRPLFDDLNQQLILPADHAALRAIAQEVADRQAFRLTIGGIYNQTFSVKKGDAVEIPELHAKVRIVGIGTESLSATIDSDLASAGTIGPFEVGYFVWPLTDNTKLQDYRISVLLLSTDNGTATVRVIGFDSELAADRFDIKEMTRLLRQSDHSVK